MIALKFKYEVSDNDMSLIEQIQRQYTSCYHFNYNRISDNPDITEIELRKLQSNLNNIDLIGSWLYQCSIKEARQTFNSLLTKQKQQIEKKEKEKDPEKKAKIKIVDPKKIVFGRKPNFIKRCQDKISKEEWKQYRLRKIYSIGEQSHYANRLFRINPDLESVTFKPNRNININIKLIGIRNRIYDLNRLYKLQQENKIAITYQFGNGYVSICAEENVKEHKIKQIKNRIFAIDMNPNYIGYSIVDWKSSSKYDIIDKGVIDLSKFYNFEANCGLKSNDPNKIHINNKKCHEITEICHYLVNLALHYRCQIFSIEDLNIESEDKEKGSDFNRQCNNTWHRGLMTQVISKLCKINNIYIHKVNSKYTSIIGNMMFRKHNLPDMISASIEIGRRGYEFHNQYITKEKEQIKNIIFPLLEDFYCGWKESLEEFNLFIENYENTGDICRYINKLNKKKNTKMMYRIPLSDRLKSFKLKSSNFWSKVLK